MKNMESHISQTGCWLSGFSNYCGCAVDNSRADEVFSGTFKLHTVVTTIALIKRLFLVALMIVIVVFGCSPLLRNLGSLAFGKARKGTTVFLFFDYVLSAICKYLKMFPDCDPPEAHK